MGIRRTVILGVAAVVIGAIAGAAPAGSAASRDAGRMGARPPVVELRGTAGDDRLVLSVRHGDIVAGPTLARARALVFGGTSVRTSSAVRLRVSGGAGSDLLIVDASGGLPVPDGGLVDGGGGGAGIDTLALRGGRFHSETVNALGGGSGRIVLDGRRIDYRGLEPVQDSVPVSNYQFNAPPPSPSGPGGDTLNLVDTAMKGFDEINGNDGAAPFEFIDFSNKVNVTINGSSGPDTISMHVTVGATSLTTVTLDGAGGEDTTDVSATPLDVSTTATDSAGTEDHVALGGAGSVAGLVGAVSVTNPLGLSALKIDDREDPDARAATITNGSVQGLAPVAIDFVGGDVASLHVLGGLAADAWVVASTPPVATTLATGGGADRVTVEGTVGPLSVAGGPGNDRMTATASPPVGKSIAFVGGPGNDLFHLTAGVSLGAEIKGGPGTDTVSYSGLATGVVVDLAGGPGTGTGTLGLASIENATGGNGRDQLAGSGAANVLSGGPGNDILTGRAGPDRLLGGPGNDTLNARDGVHGNDRVNGGRGIDTCSVDPGDHVTGCEH
jgi:Ca2+-binding RTX toxin-like protein